MRYYNIFDLKLQELHIFIAAAEYESITKAAELLYLTPSQVSKVIKKLEYEWEIQIFIRDKNSLSLTPAGRHIYQELSPIIRNIEKVLEEAAHIQEVKPFIRIGCPTLSVPNELFVPGVKAFRKLVPDTSVSIKCKDTLSELRKMLIGGEVDLIYTTSPAFFEGKEQFQWIEVEQLPLYIVMNKEHPLAGKENLQVKDLEFQPFVLLNPSSELYTDFAVNLCQKNGFTPRIARYVPNIYSQLMELSINPLAVGIQVCKASSLDENLFFCRIPEVYWKMGFACRNDAPKIIKKFIECTIACLKEGQENER